MFVLFLLLVRLADGNQLTASFCLLAPDHYLPRGTTMDFENKANSLWKNFFKLNMPQIRAFHMSWLAFFLLLLCVVWNRAPYEGRS